MRRLAEGDRSVFDAVFQTLWPLSRAFCTRFLGDATDGDDAAQEALLKMFARAHTYNAEKDPVTWALTLAAYECRTVRKRRSRRREVPETEQVVTRDDLATLLDMQRMVQELALALPAEDLEAIRAAAGIGNNPEVSASTFRKRLQRARKRARTFLRSRYGTE